MKNYYLLLLLVLALFGCKKDDDESNNPTPVATTGVIILNEGTFTFGNASISLYDPETQEISNNVFTNNTGRPLGDVAQSISLINDKVYVVVNNSGKIEVLNLADLTSVATITGFTAPRYMIPLGDGRAYVTDIYGDAISIIDLNANQITGSIPLSGWTEQLVMARDMVYICNRDSNRVEIIDPQTDQKTGSIAITGGPTSIVKDAAGKLWVLADTSGPQRTSGSLSKIDPATNTIELELLTNPGSAMGNLQIAPNGQTLYFTQQGIRSMDVSAQSLPANTIIPANGRTLYALGVNLSGEELYTADAIDYVQQGWVYRYDAVTYTLIDSFKAGVIPNQFLFY